MIDMSSFEVKIIKGSIPSIYLDTNVLIELAKYEKGCCKDVHIDNIGKLYDTLTILMREKRILCVLGNQYEEMAATRAREVAREFLFRFTNMELKAPEQIKNMQLKMGYRAFVKNAPLCSFDLSSIIEKSKCVSNSSIEVHAIPMYSCEQIKQFEQDKQNLAIKLNEAKTNTKISKKYDAQLDLELQADFQVFRYFLEHYADSEKSYMNMLDALGVVYRRVGINPYDSSHDDIVKAVDNHNNFLLSLYHHKIPYVWICSVLFAHIMQRQNKIIKSDNLDITWASAYLPFVDYAVTDTSFCNLLNQSGLADSYGTKVYCFKTLDKLLEEL